MRYLLPSCSFVCGFSIAAALACLERAYRLDPGLPREEYVTLAALAGMLAFLSALVAFVVEVDRADIHPSPVQEVTDVW